MGLKAVNCAMLVVGCGGCFTAVSSYSTSMSMAAVFSKDRYCEADSVSP